MGGCIRGMFARLMTLIRSISAGGSSRLTVRTGKAVFKADVALLGLTGSGAGLGGLRLCSLP